MMPLRAGSVFAGDYEIVRPISAGGMGIVYEVIHRPTARRRALKVMLANIVSDPEMRARFSLEAIVSAGIDSEHITEIFDAGIDSESDCPFLVMELLRGEDLAVRLKRGERFSAEETISLLEQVARALDKTHSKGVVHRDLKPDNLFMTRRDDGSVRMKILDFGIAKVIKKDFTGPQATTKTFGTPYYMAREQITGESALIGPQSDLYAIAQIAFTLLVGLAYFQEEAKENGGNILSVLLAVGKGTAEPATTRALRYGVELPPAFDAWFAKATALNPKSRFDAAAPMISALRGVLTTEVRVLPDDERALLAEGAARASSERIEDSFSSLERKDAGASVGPNATARDLSVHTAGPQSLTAAPQQQTSGRRSSLFFLVGTIILGGSISLAAIRYSRGASVVRVMTSAAATSTPTAVEAAEPSHSTADPLVSLPGTGTEALGAKGAASAPPQSPASAKPRNVVGSRLPKRDTGEDSAPPPTTAQATPPKLPKTSKGPFENSL